MMCSELKVIELDTEDVIYYMDWNPFKLNPESLRRAIKLLMASRCSKLDLIPEWREELREIALKLSGGVDPALAGAPHVIAHSLIAKDVGLWWCDKTNKGKMFTVDLCRDPEVGYQGSLAVGRRGIGLNPWAIPLQVGSPPSSCMHLSTPMFPSV